ncbi:MAG: sugar phosphate isomerase/epimerase [Anaerolineae bacterium]|nr:sugar phosphate isomerase/epimerase [Anaerolineae bacterium]
MKIGAVSLGWAGKPLPEAMAEIAAFGGNCIEINGRPGVHAGLVLDESTARQVRAWAAAAGLEISAVSGYCDFAQTDRAARAREVARLMSACRAAHALEVRIVRAFAGDARPGLTLDTAWPWLVAGLQEAARQAEPLGVLLAVENHGRLLNDGPALARLMREVAAANVGITLDTGNFAWAGHPAEQVRADFAAVLPYVINVHVKDGIWRPGAGGEPAFDFVPAGQGRLPLAEWLDALAAAGYAGAACSEYEGAGDFRAGTRMSIAYLQRWM